MPESNKYLDILKVLEFGAEGGRETLYRLLPYGEVQFTWRTYGTSIGEDDGGTRGAEGRRRHGWQETSTARDETWGDYTEEFEDISEYLIHRTKALAGLIPEYIDVNFRDQVFKAFVDSLRDPDMCHPQWLFGELNGGGWERWQKQLQLCADYHEITIHSAVFANPIRSICLDYDSVKTVQQLLNAIYLSLLHTTTPARSYGRHWRLYDLVNCQGFVLPHDDRDDRLYDAGIKQGGQWVVYGVV